MQRWGFLISILAALSGTPLRQAEAAADFARSITDQIPCGHVEIPDGGVGDDAEVGIPATAHQDHAVDPLVDFDFMSLPLSTQVVALTLEEGIRERVWWPQSPPTLRFAWLQTFRF